MTETTTGQIDTDTFRATIPNGMVPLGAAVVQQGMTESTVRTDLVSVTAVVPTDVLLGQSGWYVKGWHGEPGGIAGRKVTRVRRSD